jgi:hypothetical protein
MLKKMVFVLTVIAAAWVLYASTVAAETQEFALTNKLVASVVEYYTADNLWTATDDGKWHAKSLEGGTVNIGAYNVNTIEGETGTDPGMNLQVSGTRGTITEIKAVERVFYVGNKSQSGGFSTSNTNLKYWIDVANQTVRSSEHFTYMMISIFSGTTLIGDKIIYEEGTADAKFITPDMKSIPSVGMEGQVVNLPMSELFGAGRQFDTIRVRLSNYVYDNGCRIRIGWLKLVYSDVVNTPDPTTTTTIPITTTTTVTEDVPDTTTTVDPEPVDADPDTTTTVDPEPVVVDNETTIDPMGVDSNCDCTSVQTEYNSLLETYGICLENTTTVQIELDAANARISELESQVANLQSTIDALESEINSGYTQPVKDGVDIAGSTTEMEINKVDGDSFFGGTVSVVYLDTDGNELGETQISNQYNSLKNKSGKFVVQAGQIYKIRIRPHLYMGLMNIDSDAEGVEVEKTVGCRILKFQGLVDSSTYEVILKYGPKQK